MIPRTTGVAARLAIVWTLLAAMCGAGRAQAQPYQLSIGSEYRTGCFTAPCACAPLQYAMSGGLALVRQPPSPPYTQFQVVAVNWKVQFPVGLVSIVGSGTYRVGGTSALQQQMTLDVSVGSGPVVHFDSGLVPGGDSFPRILIDLSRHGKLECGDTLLRVRASPGGATTDVASGGLRLTALAPNPFRSDTRLEFTLLESGPVRASVLDLAGRRLRTVLDGGWLEAGPRSIAWDGRADDGHACPAGCYFVRVEAGGEVVQRLVSKLH
jgi:hypothetical protein